MTPETAAPLAITAARQTELRAMRMANEAAERPPYAWTRLSNADLAWLIAEHAWRTDDAPGPRVDLRAANLIGVNLAGMQLRQARFEGAVLFQVDLRGADLFFAHFTDADLREAQAEGANLAMARMRGARLQGAQLLGANLRQSWLTEADLSGAKLDGADLTGAQLQKADLHEASLLGTSLKWARLEDADLRAAHLTQADLRSTHLERAQLDSADLRSARLEGAWCQDAAFYAARLEGADLRGARLQGAQLAGATVTGARWAQADLTDVDLTRVGDLPELASQPTGDEVAATTNTGTPAERAAAWRTAAAATARLAAALGANPSLDLALVQQLQDRVARLRRMALRSEARISPSARLVWARHALTYSIIGNGAAPGRVALWAAALVVLVAALLLAFGGTSNLFTALSLSLSSLTTPGYSYFASQMHGNPVLTSIGAGESLLGDVLAALFIAAVVKKNQE